MTFRRDTILAYWTFKAVSLRIKSDAKQLLIAGYEAKPTLLGPLAGAPEPDTTSATSSRKMIAQHQ